MDSQHTFWQDKLDANIVRFSDIENTTCLQRLTNKSYHEGEEEED